MHIRFFSPLRKIKSSNDEKDLPQVGSISLSVAVHTTENRKFVIQFN